MNKNIVIRNSENMAAVNEVDNHDLSNPLVSIIVITYNSSKYVLETLESAKAQTYQNIELIVSDDCSTDNTVEICRDWIEENKERFVRTEMITVEKNTGIPANCNRGLYASRGEWVKFIAGDDALLNNCIEVNMEFVNHYFEKVSVVHSDVYYYLDNFKEENFLKKSNKCVDIISEKSITTDEQLFFFVRGIVPLAPTVFLNRSVLIDLNGFDERLPYEDGPFWVKCARNNYKLHYLNQVTIKYRLYDSFSNSNNETELLFKLIYKSDKVVYEKVYRYYLSLYEIFAKKSNFFIKDLFVRYNLNKKTTFNALLYNIINFPFYWHWLLKVKIKTFQIKRNVKKRTNSYPINNY